MNQTFRMDNELITTTWRHRNVHTPNDVLEKMKANWTERATTNAPISAELTIERRKNEYLERTEANWLDSRREIGVKKAILEKAGGVGTLRLKMLWSLPSNRQPCEAEAEIWG